MSYEKLKARMLEKFDSWYTRRQIAKGKMTYGRQPEAGAKTKVKATISAVVTRADGTVENLGEIWKGDAHGNRPN